MHHLVILLGPPGAGKGTIARQAVDQLGLHWLSSGDLLRQETRAGTDRGRAIAARIDDGNLVNDELIIDLVTSEMRDIPAGKGILLDGFPRNVAQALALEGHPLKATWSVRQVIQLEVNVAEIERRILKRATEEGRADDTLETFRRRIAVYQDQTGPVADYYRQQGCLTSVDGMGSPAEVFARVEPCIRQSLKGSARERQKEAG